MQTSDFNISHAGFKFSSFWAYWGLTTLADWQGIFGVATSLFSATAALLGVIYSVMLIREIKAKRRAREMREEAYMRRDIERELDEIDAAPLR